MVSIKEEGGQTIAKEQETIERLNKKLDATEDDEITINLLYQKIDLLEDMLKEKDSEIERLEQTLAKNIARNITDSMKESAKSKEDLEMLNAGWQIELEKKDKIIDLIINAVYKRFKAELLLEYGFENEEQFKQYFERKSE